MREPPKLSEKKMSYHFTRILFMKDSHLWVNILLIKLISSMTRRISSFTKKHIKRCKKKEFSKPTKAVFQSFKFIFLKLPLSACSDEIK